MHRKSAVSTYKSFFSGALFSWSSRWKQFPSEGMAGFTPRIQICICLCHWWCCLTLEMGISTFGISCLCAHSDVVCVFGGAFWQSDRQHCARFINIWWHVPKFKRHLKSKENDANVSRGDVGIPASSVWWSTMHTQCVLRTLTSRMEKRARYLYR